MPETNDSTHPVSTETTTREKFEQEKLSRRVALRKIGMTTGMALFGMFAVDDLARVAIKRMEAQKATHEIGEAVAKEFKNSGIVFAADPGSSSNPCVNCVTAKTGCLDDADKALARCVALAGKDKVKQEACYNFYPGESVGCRDSFIRCCHLNNCNCGV